MVVCFLLADDFPFPGWGEFNNGLRLPQSAVAGAASPSRFSCELEPLSSLPVVLARQALRY